MIDIDSFYMMMQEVCDELPDVFFRELHHGVQLSEETKISPHAVDEDLIIMGEYHRSPLGNKITIYYGSFAKTCSWMDSEQLKGKLREVVRHEFRHHMENLSGMHGKDSLDHDDMEELRNMLSTFP